VPPPLMAGGSDGMVAMLVGRESWVLHAARAAETGALKVFFCV
jgi:hypothetical protein